MYLLSQAILPKHFIIFKSKELTKLSSMVTKKWRKEWSHGKSTSWDLIKPVVHIILAIVEGGVLRRGHWHGKKALSYNI